MMQTRYEFPNGGYLIDKTGSVNDYNMQTGNKLEEGDYVTTGTFVFFFLIKLLDLTQTSAMAKMFLLGY